MSNIKFTRRQVLAGCAIGGVVSCTWKLPAADGVGQLKFVIATDTHLGRNDKLAAENQWRQAVAEINATDSKFVLHLGDIVDSGREKQYPIYEEIRKTLKIPIHEIPGNHDPDELFRKHVSAEVDRCVDYGGIRFILFDNAHRDSHDGFITAEQIDWIDRQCSDAKKNGLKIVICCHVPIHANKHPDRGWYVKPVDGQTAFYEIQTRYASQILACLHGHFHNGIRGWRDHNDMLEVLCPSVCYNQNRRFKERIANGEVGGFFVDELRPGYVIAEIGKGRFSMSYKPVGHECSESYKADLPD